MLFLKKLYYLCSWLVHPVIYPLKLSQNMCVDHLSELHRLVNIVKQWMSGIANLSSTIFQLETYYCQLQSSFLDYSQNKPSVSFKTLAVHQSLQEHFMNINKSIIFLLSSEHRTSNNKRISQYYCQTTYHWS